MDTLPSQWMSQQLQAGRRLCLILEGENAARQPMLAARGLLEYCSLYAQTPLAEIATAGPLILLLDQVGEPALLGQFANRGPDGRDATLARPAAGRAAR